MLDKNTYLILKRCAPLGRTLCIGHPELAWNMRRPERFADVVLRELGATVVHSMDIGFSPDVRHDLNEPLATSVDPYDTVFDCGTAEHIPNIGQALRTYMQLVVVGGRVVVNAVTDSNQQHGFYQLSPQLFHNLFGQNGFDVQVWSYRIGPFSRLLAEPRDDSQALALSLPRFLVAVCRKEREVPFRWPVQPVFLLPEQAYNERHSSFNRPRLWRNAWALLRTVIRRL